MTFIPAYNGFLSLSRWMRSTGDPFNRKRLALRNYLATTAGEDNPHSLSVMPSPPTITTDITATPATTYPKALVMATPADLAQVRVEGGDPTIVASVFLKPAAATMSAAARIYVASRVSVSMNADEVAFYVIGTTIKYRFLVDELDGNGPRYVDLTGTTAGATTGTGTNYIILTFASKAARVVTIELQQSCAIRNIRIKTADSFLTKPVVKPIRAIALGDSVTAATGATAFGDSYVAIAGDYLGIELWPSGVGSTGYSNTFGGTRYKLPERAGIDLDAMLATGPIDVVFVVMGLNDLGAQTNVLADANTSFDIIRTKCPTALVYVIGTWDASAPSPTGGTYASLKAIIQAAIGTRPGFTFLDPEGVAYTKPGGDPIHPDTAGHATLGLWTDAALRAAVA